VSVVTNKTQKSNTKTLLSFVEKEERAVRISLLDGNKRFIRLKKFSIMK
jgi:hypothetical protein